MEPKEWTGKEQKFIVNEWMNLDYNEIKGDEMSRHFLILGETGSGKTKSAIIPLLKAVLQYSEQNRPSLLVIDPKNELFGKIKAFKNVMDFKPNGKEKQKVIHFFEGIDLENISSDEIKSKVLGLFPNAMASEKDTFWIQQTDLCIKSFIDIDLHQYSIGGAKQIKSFWTNFVEFSRDKLTELKNDFDEENNKENKDSRRIDSIRKDYATYSQIVKKIKYDESNYFERFNYLINEINSLKLFLEYWNRLDEEVSSLESYRFLNSIVFLHEKEVWGQLSGVIGFVNNFFGTLCSKELILSVNFNPFEAPKDRFISIADCMNNGFCMVYSPEQNSDIGDLIGRCLKSKFFEYTFKRQNQDRPFAYVCDEFQRFITA